MIVRESRYKNQEPRCFRTGIFALGSLFLVLFSTCVSGNAQSLDKAELEIDTNYLKLGQQTVLEFSVTCRKTRTPSQLDWKNILKGKLDIISVGNVDTISSTDEQLQLRQEIIVTKFSEDTVRIDSLWVPLVKNRDTVFLRSNALSIYPILEQVDLDQDIRDIKSPVEIPLSWMEVLPYILGFVTLLILILIIMLIVRWTKRKRKLKEEVLAPEPPKVIIPAHIIALERLNDIKKDEKWLTTESKLYLSELTDVLREYIFNRWNFDARESTTEEILAADFILSIPHDQLSLLKEILGTSDFVKFAKANTSTDENKRMLEQSFSFVNQTKEEDKVE